MSEHIIYNIFKQFLMKKGEYEVIFILLNIQIFSSLIKQNNKKMDKNRGKNVRWL